MAQSNKAIVIVANADAKILDMPAPKLPADDYIIVKTSAVAVNPTDWKHIEWADKLGCVDTRTGCDYAGTVVEVGSKVTKPFKKGDRICGAVNGANALRKEDGSFQTYIAVKGDIQIPTPSNLTDEQAATLGISVSTVGQGLYQKLGLALPTSPIATKQPVLIYGGSTATGISGIQFASLSGYNVITTASPKNHEYMKSLGATHVFDYKSETAPEEIRQLTGGKLAVAWDCQSDEKSAAFCARALSPDLPSKYSSLLPGVDAAVNAVNPKVECSSSLAYSIFGEDFVFMQKMDAKPEDFEFGKMFWEISHKLLTDGKVKPINTIVNRGGSGLEGVLVGLKELQEGKVSAGKLVYTL